VNANLLDWTYNPLTAAYFAVHEEAAWDAAIFVYCPYTLAIPSINPWTVEGVLTYKPSHIVSRITRQMGVFTVHNPPLLPLDRNDHEPDNIELIVISRNYRNQLMYELDMYGINHANLFPDLDGLSRHANWKMVNSIVPASL
jgi:hypothetical protein